MPDPHPVPKQVGRYEIEGFLSQGGMGRLYLARDPVIGRRLAIKLIRDGIDDADLRARFMQEARAGGGLKHPNVVTVFDAGDHEGHPFIAMEYVSGETVADLIDRAEPISVARKLQLVEQLCRGLASAHREGLVHRDIKPSNLMVDDDGTLKILDFGIARVAESGLTSSGVAIGTVNYMSPEQAAGSTVDHRSDVFSVGSVFYELLAYQPAFPGSIQDGVLYRIVHGEPASLRDACPGLPTAVTDTVGRALRLNPAERYQDLDAMAVELVAIRENLDAEGSAHPPADDQETMLAPARLDLAATVTRQRVGDEEHRRRRPWWMWAAGMAAVLVALGAVVAPRLSSWPDLAPGRSRAATPVPSAGRDAPGGSALPAGTPLVTPAGGPPPSLDPPVTATPETTPPADRAPADRSGADAAAGRPSTSDPVPDDRPEPTAAIARLNALRAQAVDAFIQGDRESSLRAAASVLQLVPDDPDAQRVLDRLQQDAQQEAEQARQGGAPVWNTRSALPAGPTGGIRRTDTP